MAGPASVLGAPQKRQSTLTGLSTNQVTEPITSDVGQIFWVKNGLNPAELHINSWLHSGTSVQVSTEKLADNWNTYFILLTSKL
jgi:hypothetical protein